MNYPQKLPPHDIFNFSSAKVLAKSGSSRTKSYYHRLGSFLPYLPMHSHDFYEINIITSGNSMHYINDQIYYAPQGTVFVIPPRYKHGYFSDEDTEIFHLILDNTFIASYNPLLTSLKGYSFLFDIEPILRRRNKMNLFLILNAAELEYIIPVIERLCSYEDKTGKSNTLTKEFLALNFIAELCNSHIENYPEKANGIPEKTNDIVKTMEYISRNYKEKINFDDLAQKNNMSYTTFFRHFKKTCSMTPSQYLTDCRINEAINMMNQKKYTLTEIALSCGFYDASHFTKSFISVKGYSPSDYLASTNNI